MADLPQDSTTTQITEIMKEEIPETGFNLQEETAPFAQDLLHFL